MRLLQKCLENRAANAFLILLVLTFLATACCIKNEGGSGSAQTGSDEYCTKQDSGEKMSYAEAKQIALASECVKEGPLKETYMCNDYTGTWWIDLDIKKENCNPACVIDVVTKKAEINWRCTGLIQPVED